MRLKRIFAMMVSACLCAGGLSGCSNMQGFYRDSVDAGAQLGLLPDHRLQRSNHYVFPLDTGFYVSWSDPRVTDFRAGTGTGEGSAAALEADTAALLYQQLAARFPRVEFAASAQSLQVARVSAVRQQLDYLIYPQLLLLHDTVGTGRSMAYASGTQGMQPATGLAEDRAALQLTVIEARSGRVVDVVTLDSRSGILSMAGRRPRHLLHRALASYADSIFPRS